MKVTNITLFTMSACPLGRTMRHVLEINRFPDSATLELVEFEEDLARVYINHAEKTISEGNAYKMKRCLLQTLHSYGTK